MLPQTFCEAKASGRRLRRQVLRSFALRRDLNRPAQPRLSDLLLFGQLLSIGRQRRRSDTSASKRPAGTLPGQPAASAAAAPYPIRVSAADRQEEFNRSSSCIFLIDLRSFPPMASRTLDFPFVPSCLVKRFVRAYRIAVQRIPVPYAPQDRKRSTRGDSN